MEASPIPPSELGRLHPTYYRDVDLILLKSRIERPIPHTINIISHIFLGVDAHHLLARIGILASSALWTVDESFDGWQSYFPEAPEPIVADLSIPSRTLEHGPFEGEGLALKIVTGPDRTHILILFASPSDTVTPVQIGPDCLAFIEDGHLFGFFVPLSIRPRGVTLSGRTAPPTLPSLGPTDILL